MSKKRIKIGGSAQFLKILSDFFLQKKSKFIQVKKSCVPSLACALLYLSKTTLPSKCRLVDGLFQIWPNLDRFFRRFSLTSDSITETVLFDGSQIHYQNSKMEFSRPPHRCLQCGVECAYVEHAPGGQLVRLAFTLRGTLFKFSLLFRCSMTRVEQSAASAFFGAQELSGRQSRCSDIGVEGSCSSSAEWANHSAPAPRSCRDKAFGLRSTVDNSAPGIASCNKPSKPSVR